MIERTEVASLRMAAGCVDTTLRPGERSAAGFHLWYATTR